MGPLKQSLVENISLQRCNCTVALFAKEAGFFRFSKICRKKSMLENFRANVLKWEYHFSISSITHTSNLHLFHCVVCVFEAPAYSPTIYFYCRYLQIGDDRLYQEVESIEDLYKIVEHCLEEYNQTHKTQMNLVIFRYLFDRIVVTVRFLSNPEKH